MANDKEVELTKQAVKAPANTTPAKRTVARKTSRTASSAKKQIPATKITNTQVRKPGSASIRNKASQKQLNAVEEIQMSKKKMERDSFTMPKDEYAQLTVLKKRLEELGRPAKKSELLRAGIKLLTQMTDTRLKATMMAIPVIKTGRPKHKK